MNIKGVNNLRPLRIGKSGFGNIFAGELDDGRKVVVKVLRDPTPARRRIFRREYKVLLAGAKSKRLVPVLAADLDGPEPYIVMPYFEGGAITTWAGKLTPDQLRVVAAQMCEALADLHGLKIAQGDVKPDNVLVAGSGTVHVADPLGNGEGCTVTVGNGGGTPGYWAPEVRTGGAITMEADVYSLAASLFHLATGKAPVDGDDLDPALYGVTLPLDLRNLILACSHWDASKRPNIETVRAWLANRVVPVVQKAKTVAKQAAAGVSWGPIIAVGLLVVVVIGVVAVLTKKGTA